MGGDVAVVGGGEGGGVAEAGVAAAAGDVELQAVDGVEEADGVGGGADVFAGGDFAAHRVAHQAQAGGVVAGDRFLEPGDAEAVQFVAHAAGLAGTVRAVGVDHDPGVRADELVHQADSLQVPPRIDPDLDLHAGAARGLPVHHLFGEFVVGEVHEAARPVHRRRVPHLAEQGGQRQFQQSRLQIPQRDVDRADRVRHHTGGPDIAARLAHSLPQVRNVFGRTAAQQRREVLFDDGGGGRGTVGPAQPAFVVGEHGHHDGRGGVPAQGAVRFRMRCGESVDLDGDVVDGGNAVHGRPPRRASASSSTVCRGRIAGRKWRTWVRQLNPSARIAASGDAARSAGRSWSCAQATDTS